MRVGIAVLLCCAAGSTAAQRPAGLDPSRNNLVYPPGYPQAKAQSIGAERIGAGATPLIFIAGWGFSAGSFRGFARSIASEYTSYLITLPGFGGTPGWPMPDDSISYSTTPWLSLSSAAVARMMADQGVSNAIVIGHFIIGSHVALELAQRDPERIRGLILVGGELSRYWPSRADTTGRTPSTASQRAASVDRWLVPQFFRYVTDSTWHANNYLPHTFSVDSARASSLWAEQAAVPLPIMIRYLSEFYATEFAPRLDSIPLPMLILEPGFNATILPDPRTPYLETFFQESWAPAVGRDNIDVRLMPNAAVHMWLDQPERFRAELKAFTARSSQR